MELHIDDKGRATLVTRMTPKMTMIVPHLEGRRKWLKDGGLRLENTEHNLAILRQHDPQLVVKDHAAVVQETKLFDLVGVAPYETKVEPFPHQITALELARQKDHFGLFMEQGTAKTKIGLDLAGERFWDRKISGLFVVAPKGVHEQWTEAQMPTHYGAEFEYVNWPIKGDELPRSLLPGNCLKVMTMNWQALRTTRGLAMAQKFAAEHDGMIMMIGDESHHIKNDISKSWKNANAMGQMCRYRMIMTGTPIAKDLFDEWAQMKFLDERIIGIRYRSAFKTMYCVMGGYQNQAVIGHRNVEHFRKKCEPYMFRVNQEDVGILPKLYDPPWKFKLTQHQRKMMAEIKRDLITDIRREIEALLAGQSVATAANPAVAVLRMQQISNGFVPDDDGNIVDLIPGENPRMVALKEYLEAYPGKVLVWCRFREDIRQIKKELGDAAVTFYGQDSRKQRKAAMDAFLNSPDVLYFVSNPAVGGEGIDGLQTVCNRAVYYSNSDNSIQRWQSEDRISRFGQIGGAVLTDLQAIGSPDAKIIRNQKRKEVIAEMALGDVLSWLEGDDDW
jgi:hypothetical protein